MDIKKYFTLKCQRCTFRHWGLILGSWVLCSVAYIYLYPYLGEPTGSLFNIPVVITAWTFGVMGGLSGGLITFILVFLINPGQSSIEVLLKAAFPGLPVIFIIGLVAGWVRNLFYVTKEQAAELELERVSLEKEIALRKQTEEVLRESESRYRLIAENARDLIWVCGMDMKFTYVSPSITRLRGYTVEEAMEQPLSEMLTPGSMECAEKIIQEVNIKFKSGEYIPESHSSWVLELEVTHKDGTTIWTETQVSFLYEKSGQFLGLLGVTRDIVQRKQAEKALQDLNTELEMRVKQRTGELVAANAKLVQEVEERKQVEAELRSSEERLRQLAETIDEMFWLTDIKNNCAIYVSPACEEITGYPKERYEEDPWFWFNIIHPDDQERMKALEEVHRRDNVPFDAECRIVCQDGSTKWVWTRAFLLKNDQNEVYRVAGVTKDITTRKLFEQQIQASLQEKEVLLKEIHHRVKNNLQIISSLLNLASSRIDDPASRSAFKESQNRVHSMALIHEKLYGSNDLARIDFKDYIQNLTGFLFRSYQSMNSHVSLILEVQNVYLNIDTAVPCGLILNELVTNALKHAFPAGGPGEIHVRFFQENEQECCLEISDTGPGLPDNFKEKSTNSLGLVLVNTLVDQLGGRLEIDSLQGARFSIHFPIPESHA